MKPMKRNLNELSKQLSKSVKSHAKSALILGKESKKLTKASQSHSKQVNKLKRMSKRASYTNLTKLANKRDEEKKPGMSTNLPAVLGVVGSGALTQTYNNNLKALTKKREDIHTRVRDLEGAFISTQNKFNDKYDAATQIAQQFGHAEAPNLANDLVGELDEIAKEYKEINDELPAFNKRLAEYRKDYDHDFEYIEDIKDDALRSDFNDRFFKHEHLKSREDNLRAFRKLYGEATEELAPRLEK